MESVSKTVLTDLILLYSLYGFRYKICECQHRSRHTYRVIEAQFPQSELIALPSIGIAVYLADPSTYAKYESDYQSYKGDYGPCQWYCPNATRGWQCRDRSGQGLGLGGDALGCRGLRRGGSGHPLQGNVNARCLRSR